jgi:hypothetical protein
MVLTAVLAIPDRKVQRATTRRTYMQMYTHVHTWCWLMKSRLLCVAGGSQVVMVLFYQQRNDRDDRGSDDWWRSRCNDCYEEGMCCAQCWLNMWLFSIHVDILVLTNVHEYYGTSVLRCEHLTVRRVCVCVCVNRKHKLDVTFNGPLDLPYGHMPYDIVRRIHFNFQTDVLIVQLYDTFTR